MERQYLSVSALSKYIETKFVRDPYLREVYVTGELSNVTVRGTMAYFNLKGEGSVLSGVMFTQVLSKLDFKLEEGMQVNAIGEIRTYSGQSRYQMVVKQIVPYGIGKFTQELARLKEKFTKEGLFKEEHKQKIPKFPKKIAVVTSPTGAVIRDIITTVNRRYPIVQIVLFPTVVQGNLAAKSIVENIQKADQLGEFDTIIVGRGGGSVEDLWCFNDEAVVRSIFEAKTPIISSVGHETDVTLSDFVSDMRAATPTAAAELATPVMDQEIENILSLQMRLLQNLRKRVAHERKMVENLTKSYIFSSPQRFYESYMQKVDLLKNELYQVQKDLIQDKKQSYQTYFYRILQLNPEKEIEKKRLIYENLQDNFKKLSQNVVKEKRAQFVNVLSALDLLSPTQILLRGYAIATQDEKIVKSVEEVAVNEELKITVSDGILHTKIFKMEKK